MITITVGFEGKPNNLKDANVCAIHHASTRRIAGNRLIAQYICETDDYDQAMNIVMDTIDIDRAEGFGCRLLWIG